MVTRPEMEATIERIVDEKLEEKIAPLREMQEKTLSILDRMMPSFERNNIEDAARDVQITRHDGWIRQIASETGVKLKS